LFVGGDVDVLVVGGNAGGNGMLLVITDDVGCDAGDGAHLVVISFKWVLYDCNNVVRSL